MEETTNSEGFRYKFLEDDINSMEVLGSTDSLTKWGLDRLNEFRMIKRQLEILELIKKSFKDDVFGGK